MPEKNDTRAPWQRRTWQGLALMMPCLALLLVGMWIDNEELQKMGWTGLATFGAWAGLGIERRAVRAWAPVALVPAALLLAGCQTPTATMNMKVGLNEHTYLAVDADAGQLEAGAAAGLGVAELRGNTGRLSLGLLTGAQVDGAGARVDPFGLLCRLEALASADTALTPVCLGRLAAENRENLR